MTPAGPRFAAVTPLGISLPERSIRANPTAIAIPSRPSHKPASAMTAQSTAVTVGHGDSTASTGAKKKPVPMYHAEPARSDATTKRSQRGTGAVAG